MNSVYKKIALVCVLSVAANQAALAIEVPSFWNWMKVNQKTTAAIVAGFAALAIFAQWMSKPTVKNRKPVLYVPGSIFTWNFSEKGVTIMPVSSKQTFEAQYPALSESLATLTKTPKGFIASEIDTRPNLRVLTLVDFPKSFKQSVSFDKPAGCVVFANPVDEGDPIVIEYMAMGKTGNQKGMLDPLLGTHEDIALSQYMDKDSAFVTRNFLEQQITTRDGVKPTYEGNVFRRDAVRAKLKAAAAATSSPAESATA